MNENTAITSGVSKNAVGEWPVLPDCFQNGLIAKFIPRIGLFDQVSGQQASFARSGTKTGINSIGSPQEIPANSFANYQNGRDSIYLEPSWTNAITWSKSFTADNGYSLVNVNSTVSATEYVICDVTGAPYYATLFTATSDGGYVRKTSLAVVNGTRTTLSAYIKPVSGNQFLEFSDGTNIFKVFYNPSTDAFYGVVNAGSLVYTATSEPIVSRPGWLRLAITITPKTTSSSAYFGIGAELSTNSFYLSAVQKVDGSMRGSYVYTTTSAAATSTEGSDTSGNGLQLPLTQAMIDSLTGEVSDWTASWSHVSGTAPAYSGGNKTLAYSAQTSTDYHALLSARIAIGRTVEISYTITGYTGGTFKMGFGSGASGITRNANGTYTERGTMTGDTNLYAIVSGLTATIQILYIRRVLENGQTNPGEGTICQWVDIPWPSSAVPNNTSIGMLAASTSPSGTQTIYRSPSGTLSARIADGASTASINTEFASGRYCIISQFSAQLGKMRAGLYNPTTKTLTWSSPTLAGGSAYRGFFPIYGTGNQQRLRWGYGLTNFPVGIGDMYWFNQIIDDNNLNILLQSTGTPYTSDGYGQQVFIVQDGQYVVDTYGSYVTL